MVGVSSLPPVGLPLPMAGRLSALMVVLLLPPSTLPLARILSALVVAQRREFSPTALLKIPLRRMP